MLRVLSKPIYTDKEKAHDGTAADGGGESWRRVEAHHLGASVATLMAVAMTSAAAPAFAKSAASDPEPSLPEGANFGHARSQLDLGGQVTSEGNPSFRGAKIRRPMRR